MRRAFVCGCLVVVCILAGLTEPSAQSTGSITGVVRDAGGGVVPGATVVVKDEATSTPLEAVTDAEGRYQVPALLAGAYSVTVSLTGFKTAEATGIRLAPGQPLTVNLTLGRQPLLGERLRVLARSVAEHELLFQRHQRPAEERREP